MNQDPMLPPDENLESGSGTGSAPLSGEPVSSVSSPPPSEEGFMSESSRPELPAVEETARQDIENETAAEPAGVLSGGTDPEGEAEPAMVSAGTEPEVMTWPQDQESIASVSGGDEPSEDHSSSETSAPEGENQEPAASVVGEPVEAGTGERELTVAAAAEPLAEKPASPASEPEPLIMEEHELEEMEHEEHEEDEMSPEEMASLNASQLVQMADHWNRDPDPVQAGRAIQKLKPLFEAAYAQEKAEALEKYIGEGGEPEAFKFKSEDLENRFQKLYRAIQEKRKLNQEFQQRERVKNQEQKLVLLDKLRSLVNDNEHSPAFDAFRAIREEWRKIGPVGSDQARNLNASYASLCERFYSQSEIYHNLRDFDRKKNLEQKLEIIQKVEALADEPRIARVMKELMSHQEEYRTLGPVPKEKVEEIKERYKKAVDVLYERRKQFNEERRQQVAEEVALKDALVEKILPFESFSASTAREWQEKTRELIALQEEWKAIPGRFREKTLEQNKTFWAVFKKYMNAKNEFFRKLEKGRKDILSGKRALVDEVNGLKDSEDWDGVANRLREIQAEWKNLPPVFGKEGQKIYDEFKAGLDHFFGRLRDRRSGEDKVQSENLAVKEAICAEIENLAAGSKGDRTALDGFRERFRNAGFVPSRAIQKINGRFSKALIDLITRSEEIPENEKENLKINLLSSRSTYSPEGVKSLKNQEGYIQKRLQQLRREVGNLEDNMAMFKMSKNAMALLEDVQKKINLSRLEIKELESQLRDIRSAE